MTLTSIPVKTPDGLAELHQRTRRLSQRHRTVLLLVDGKRPLIEVQTMALQAGAPQSCVDDLLAQGLIVITQPTVPVTRYSAAPPGDSLQPDIWLQSVLRETVNPNNSTVSSLPPTASASTEAESPAVRTLAPDSVSGDSVSALTVPTSSLASPAQQADGGDPNKALDEARNILLRAVRREAPLAGSLTMLRLRRARTRGELHALLGEVEMRISRPQRALAAQQTLLRVRQLLSGEPESQPPTF